MSKLKKSHMMKMKMAITNRYIMKLKMKTKLKMKMKTIMNHGTMMERKVAADNRITMIIIVG